MNVTYSCPHCQRLAPSPFDGSTEQITCPHCSQQIEIPADGVQDGRIDRCLVCPSADLFVRKDFPQRVGVAIVVIGIVGSSIAWGYGHVMWTFAILFGTALVDVLLYGLVGNALMCYRCHAHYREVADIDSYEPFHLETHEKHRQQVARVGVQGMSNVEARMTKE